MVTYVTIGYGDVVPHTKGGKVIAAFLTAVGVFCFTTLLAELVEIKQASTAPAPAHPQPPPVPRARRAFG